MSEVVSIALPFNDDASVRFFLATRVLSETETPVNLRSPTLLQRITIFSDDRDATFVS